MSAGRKESNTAMDGKQRQYPRYQCKGGVEFQIPDSNKRIWGHLGDICKGGLYMEGAEPWAVGTEVQVRLEINNIEIYLEGIIVTCHPGVGMGLAIKRVNPEYVAAFEKIMQDLATAQDQQTQGAST